MKPVILVIGIKDDAVVRSSYLSVSGVNAEYYNCLLHTLLGEFEDAKEANECFQEEAKNYDYMEIKTVYKKL